MTNPPAGTKPIKEILKNVNFIQFHLSLVSCYLACPSRHSGTDRFGCSRPGFHHTFCGTGRISCGDKQRF